MSIGYHYFSSTNSSITSKPMVGITRVRTWASNLLLSMTSRIYTVNGRGGGGEGDVGGGVGGVGGW